jgi:sec-independent protein translocase protein TatB
MFGVDTSELLLIAIAALIFIGPKDLPAALRTFGRWVGKVRGMARHFNAGIEAVIREGELEEMEKKWREENERIMREFPAIGADPAADAKAYLEDGSSIPAAKANEPPPEQRELP